MILIITLFCPTIEREWKRENVSTEKLALISITKRDSTKLWRKVIPPHRLMLGESPVKFKYCLEVRQQGLFQSTYFRLKKKKKSIVGMCYFIFVNLKIHRV